MQETLQLAIERGAESWQFFGFVFAAVVTLVLTALGDLPWPRAWGLRLATKVVAFFAVAYIVLINAWTRNWLVGVLMAFKTLG